MSKILSFASSVNQTIEAKTPTKIPFKSNQLYKTISEKHSLRRESSHLALDAQSYGTKKSVFQRSKFEKLMIHKLGYEWKNIFRSLVQQDESNTNAISLSEFSRICEKHSVSILNSELIKL